MTRLTKEEIEARSAKNKAAWGTVAQKVEQHPHKVLVAGSTPARATKYKNKKVDSPDGVFDSQKEYARWLELKALEAAGKISRLRRQVQVPFVVSGTCVARWIADFEYYEHPEGSPVWEDVKSEYTRKLPVYRLKAKLVKAIYGREIRET